MDVTPQVLEEVTRRVLEALAGSLPQEEPKALLVGGGDWMPQTAGLRWVDESDYQGDIGPYELVVCRQVSGAQLCDMALGRDTTPAACAVARGLLAGKPVYLAEEGLPHRAFRATANPRYYAMWEDYVTRLTQFGVRVAPRAELERLIGSPTLPAAQPVQREEPCPQNQEPADDKQVFHGLLSAEEARRLARTCGGTLRLGAGAVLTPLARDVLREKKIVLVTEEGTPC